MNEREENIWAGYGNNMDKWEEIAWDIYTRVRRQFPNREIPGYNFEGCTWFKAGGFWCRERPDGVIMRIADDGLWIHTKGTGQGGQLWHRDVFFADPGIVSKDETIEIGK